MARPIPTPATYVDEVVSVVAGQNARATVTLGSCGIPVVLTLSMHDIYKLGRCAMQTGLEMFENQHDNVVTFTANSPRPRKAGGR